MKLVQRRSGKINVLGRDGAEAKATAKGGGIGEKIAGLMPDFVRDFAARFQMPETSDLMQRAAAFMFLAAWSIRQATQPGGPAFQVALAFFLGCWWAHKNQQSVVEEGEAEILKSIGAALLFLFVGWLVGAVIPAVLPIMPRHWTMEAGTALFIYISMFVQSAFFQPAL